MYIPQTIQVGRTRHAGHSWGYNNEFISNILGLVWFGLVSLFNGISTFIGYLMPKLFSKNNSSCFSLVYLPESERNSTISHQHDLINDDLWLRRKKLNVGFYFIGNTVHKHNKNFIYTQVDNILNLDNYLYTYISISVRSSLMSLGSRFSSFTKMLKIVISSISNASWRSRLT